MPVVGVPGPAGAAGAAGTGTIIVADEGSAVGTASVFNFVGAGVTATFSGGTAIATISGGAGVSSGTAFPGGPATDDLFYRTDLDELALYDGTRWVSVAVYSSNMGPGDVGQNGTTAGVMGRSPFDGTAQEIYIVKISMFAYVATTNTGSAFWHFNFRKQDSAVGGTTFGTANTSADSPDTALSKTISVNAVGTAATYLFWDLNTTKTGSPGALRVGARVFYRRVFT